MLVLPPSMALPAVKSLADCASYDLTVAPYLPHLQNFHNDLLATNFDPTALKHLYLTSNPMVTATAFSIATFPIFLLVSEINKNYSQVDRVWSILPTLYHVHYSVWAHMNGLDCGRVDNVLAFSVVWSLRLTFNYWRKGGYSVGSEDYRWMIIKERIGSLGFVVLNLIFISTAQILLLQAVTTPAYILLLTSRLQPTLTTPDLIISRSLLALVIFEYFADGQQWVYHQAKQTYQQTAKVPEGWTRAQMDRGFNTTGLWRYSRHPNFAAEQAIWVILYLWGAVGAGGVWWNWTVVGAIGYLGVFAGSTPITEWISQGKYPEYKVYKERVGRFLPNLLGKGWDEKEMEVLGPKVAEEAKKKGK